MRGKKKRERVSETADRSALAPQGGSGVRGEPARARRTSELTFIFATVMVAGSLESKALLSKKAAPFAG